MKALEPEWKQMENFVEELKAQHIELADKDNIINNFNKEIQQIKDNLKDKFFVAYQDSDTQINKKLSYIIRSY